MSRPMLAPLAARFDTRMSLRRRMMDNLSVRPSQEDALRMQTELRASLLTCASCRKIAACAAWLDQGHPGVPMFCAAREAFLRLEELCDEIAPECPEPQATETEVHPVKLAD